jgi:hypothetical protein
MLLRVGTQRLGNSFMFSTERLFNNFGISKLKFCFQCQMSVRSRLIMKGLAIRLVN